MGGMPELNPKPETLESMGGMPELNPKFETLKSMGEGRS
jgi:hypothetical protein